MFGRMRQYTVEWFEDGYKARFVYVQATSRRDAERRARELFPGIEVFNSYPGAGALIGWPGGS